ncbi:MAG TPA: sphingomyelin phosphodiesterase [Polyangiaceae bacterium LLY-WYZ-15_(1-7)]|nr:hypothetical protein [Sandaracinus sp.]MBJ70237.1 hypothetical protein [Sandaracinus sp.]HJL00381.1 sphingomyelin phosphodiesterase [Polyangiaceae bacterium LLY-WYZ-15_(1-7)]HJL11036.1 sphingomyelin phosphodiesterase [Polyangiaceae bacterium LLY-WYZ-15_(1-7)]HJL37506.1 sphingomyelin phosphodiesterase [Polyangiaceae bacterium LLY-WYZ-15_(1-7)]
MRASLFACVLLVACGSAAPRADTVAAPEPEPPPTPLGVDVLAYNAWMLPPVARDMGSRAAAIPRHLHGVDVVVLSELFDDGARQAIVDAMTRAGWQATPVLGADEPESCGSSLGPVQLEANMGLNGGVLILGRHRLAEVDERIFRHARGVDEEREGPACVGEDCCSAKGVLYARFETDAPGAPPCLHVFGTHLQNQAPAVGAIREANAEAPRRARARQLRMIRAFIDEAADVEACPGPVIVAGDLNLQPHELDEALALLQAEAPPFRGPPSWGAHNVYASSDAPEHLDYVLVTRDWAPPLHAINETRLLRAPHDFTRGSGIIGFTRGGVLADLSDHHAVAGRFEWDAPSAPGALHWEIGAERCETGAPMPAVQGARPSGGLLCAEGAVEDASWCRGGLAGCARGRRCVQVVDPEAEQADAFDDYVCWGAPTR